MYRGPKQMIEVGYYYLSQPRREMKTLVSVLETVPGPLAIAKMPL